MPVRSLTFYARDKNEQVAVRKASEQLNAWLNSNPGAKTISVSMQVMEFSERFLESPRVHLLLVYEVP